MKRSRLPPVLITSCVHPSAPILNLADPARRLELTLAALVSWTRLADRVRIVICDGSDHDFADDLRRAVPDRAARAAVECLHFRNDATAVAAFGKGYGEGEIVRHAIEHSETLAEAGAFAKCTGKLWVSNYPLVARLWNGRFQCLLNVHDAGRLADLELRMLDTRFYMTTVGFYRDIFWNAHRAVRDLQGHYLERAWLAALRGRGHDPARHVFPVRPSISGVSGTTGRPYPQAHPLAEQGRHWLTMARLAAKTLLHGPGTPPAPAPAPPAGPVATAKRRPPGTGAAR